MNKVDTVVFDLDGTLLDTLDDLVESVNYALEKHGLPLRTKQEVRSFLGNGIRFLMEKPLVNALPAMRNVSFPFFSRLGRITLTIVLMQQGHTRASLKC